MKTGEKIYVSKRIESINNPLLTYDEPVEYTIMPNYLTVSPASMRGYVTITTFGERVSSSWTMIANSFAFNNAFNEGDRVWLDGQTPFNDVEERYGNGASANAVIIGVNQIGNEINVFLSKNQEQVVNKV